MFNLWFFVKLSPPYKISDYAVGDLNIMRRYSVERLKSIKSRCNFIC